MGAVDGMERRRKARGSWITTLSGVRFDLLRINIRDVPLTDIAHSLAMNCRYNGHIKNFYSVAEHSILVSKLVPEEDALWGLLHDATEAFVPDIPRPFKQYIGGFENVEAQIHKGISEVYGLPLQEPDSVYDIDNRIVADEGIVLFPEIPEWVSDFVPVGCTDMIKCYTPHQAKEEFLNRFKELTE